MDGPGALLISAPGRCPLEVRCSFVASPSARLVYAALNRLAGASLTDPDRSREDGPQLSVTFLSDRQLDGPDGRTLLPHTAQNAADAR